MDPQMRIQTDTKCWKICNKESLLKPGGIM